MSSSVPPSATSPSGKSPKVDPVTPGIAKDRVLFRAAIDVIAAVSGMDHIPPGKAKDRVIPLMAWDRSGNLPSPVVSVKLAIAGSVLGVSVQSMAQAGPRPAFGQSGRGPRAFAIFLPDPSGQAPMPDVSPAHPKDRPFEHVPR